MRRTWACLLWLITCLFCSQAADVSAAWLRPLEGSGNFHSMIDMHTRARNDGTFDVVLLVSVSNRELTFVLRDGRLQGQLVAIAELLASDGTVYSGQKTIHLQTASETEAESSTLYQVFPLVLNGVAATSGQIAVSLQDQNRMRTGLLNLLKSRQARSEAAGDWEAPLRAADASGLSLADPIFLTNAPFELWRTEGGVAADLESSEVFGYLHPNRRYGVEQDKLQVFFEVEPPRDGTAEQAARPGLYVQVLANDLEFALRDTISFSEGRLAALAAGARAGVYYELDVNQLPAGAYQLSCAPASGQGRPWVAEFDVIWNLGAISRLQDELEGEGRTVYSGSELKDFLNAGQAEREVMLEKFWSRLDPTPETPVNEVYLEFRRRVSFARHSLGGFGRLGAKDPRGEVYLLLGPPSEVQAENMPLNATEFEDAIIRVHNKYAPDRAGTLAKGSDPRGTQGKGPYERTGGIPMPDSYTSRRELAATRRQVGREQAFQLWKYNHSGHQLFPSKYSGQTLGLNFLFVDRTGTGSFVLETTNAWNIGD